MKLLLLLVLCASIILLTNARSLFGSHEKILNNDQRNTFIPGGMESLMTVFRDSFIDFKNQHEKLYQSEEEEETRFSNYITSLIHVNQHNDLYNKGMKKYRMAINEFSDWSSKETEILKGFTHSNRTGSFYLSPNMKINLPDSIDWREKGAVTEVKNQRKCGSCYAFSSTGSLEGQIWRKTGKLISLSEQQIVDCDNLDHGCLGGDMAETFAYIKTVGLETEENYPYVTGYFNPNPIMKCKYNKNKVVSEDTGYVQLPAGDEETLKEALATIGPISISIFAPKSLSFYTSGIFHDESCNTWKLNHGVLLVGYGTDKESGIPYWLIKNSWGPKWGENGYFKLERNVNSCNVAMHSLYPLV